MFGGTHGSVGLKYVMCSMPYRMQMSRQGHQGSAGERPWFPGCTHRVWLRTASRACLQANAC